MTIIVLYSIIKKTKKYSLLNGGNRKALKYQGDLEYYYRNLRKYSTIIENLLADYYHLLNQVSNFVKDFEGSGKIHGSIIDIDFYNHIFVNPIDGTITPYYAESMVDKYPYETIENLLYYHNKELYKIYKKLIKTAGSKEKYEVIPSNIISGKLTKNKKI